LGCFATAVAGLVDRFPVVYGALALTKPLNEDTVRRWYELGSYTKRLPNYREALVRQRGAYKPGDSGRRGVLVDHPAVQQQIIQILQDLRGAGVPLNVSIARGVILGVLERALPGLVSEEVSQHLLGPRLRVRPDEMGHKVRACPHCRIWVCLLDGMLPASGRPAWCLHCLPHACMHACAQSAGASPAGASPATRKERKGGGKGAHWARGGARGWVTNLWVVYGAA
jgi:hypothetical protein